MSTTPLPPTTSPPPGGLSGVPGLPRWLLHLLEVLDRANLPFLASALTFDAMLALIPLAIIIIAGLGYLISQTGHLGMANPSEVLTGFLPQHGHTAVGDPFALVENIFSKIRGYRSRLTLIAIPAFLWFSTRLFGAIRTCLSSIFQVRARPAPGGFVMSYLIGYLFAKLRDLLMVAIVVALALANTVISAWLALMRAQGIALDPPWTFFVSGLGQVLGTLLAILFSLSLFMVLYRYASPKRLAWSGALLASGVATVGFELAKRLFGLYLTYLNRGGQYSVDANVGAALLIILWLWYMSLVFLIGAAAADVWDRGHAAKLLHATQASSPPSRANP
ncbi:MAG: YihY/virulence factor BrkB family protein [Gemmatimonadota bacterium]